jgi:signal transduction histidine kinase
MVDSAFFAPLINLIASQEEWLMSRILEYVKQQGYNLYAPNLMTAWQVSTCCLSEPLIKALKTNNSAPEICPHLDYIHDPIASFGILEAGLHRSQGVTIELFLGLMKYYRQAYLDLLELGNFSPDWQQSYSYFIHRFFDRIELGCVQEWFGHSEDEKNRELQTQNRYLANEKNKYLTVFQSLHDAVFLLDVNHEVVNLNRTAAQTFTQLQYTDGVYYGQYAIHLLWLSSEAQIFAQQLQQQAHQELLLPTNSGDRWFHIHWQRMLDSSEKFLATLVICTDITEFKNLAQELRNTIAKADQANKAKSDFLAHMSHELRTPLNGILGYTEILRQDLHLSPQQRQGFQMIESCGHHLLTLINEVLDLAKIEAGKIELKESEFELENFLESILDLFYSKALEKDLRLTCRYCGDLPVKVYGDDKYLRQILINLLGNALKFTEKGTVTLTLECLSSESSLSVKNSSHHLLRFTIIDTGVGIAPTHLESIFQPFEQGEQRLPLNEGTGLGLAIAYRLVTLMGGELTVDSTVGEGTQFSFTLPFRSVETAILEPGDKTTTERQNRFHTQSIKTVVKPPSAQLQALMAALDIGDYEALEREAKALGELLPDYRTYTELLLNYIQSFDEKNILRLLNISETP